MKVVIVGGSLAGLRTVQSLRRRGFDGQVVVLEASADAPYDRPPLSKEFLTSASEPDVSLTTPDELAALDIDWRGSWWASALDLADRAVVSSTGTRERFDRLVITTGAQARRLPGDGDVHELRNIADARRLRTALSQPGRRVGVIGGGFIGTEIAATARSLGHTVDLLESMPSLLLRGLPGIGYLVERLHRRHGVDVRVGTGPLEVKGASDGQAVVGEDGVLGVYDVVVSGIGCLPSTAWLEGSGLQIDDGVVCDASLQALGAPGVYAAGDVARWYHPLYEQTIRCEHWSAANEHGDIVAGGMLGEPMHYQSVPTVWSDQYGHRIQVAGLAGPDARLHVLRHDEHTDRCLAVYERRGIAVAGLTIDDAKSFGRLRRLLAAGTTIESVMEMAS